MIVKSLEHLNQISKKISQKLENGDCIFLIGEIGVGKTTFARSFINNLQKKKGVKQTQVLSPTFNLLYEYDINSFKIMHYDLYRIKDVKELKQLGIFKDETSSIKIIEWPELIETNISNRLELHLTYSSKDDERKLNVIGFGKWKNFSKNEF